MPVGAERLGGCKGNQRWCTLVLAVVPAPVFLAPAPPSAVPVADPSEWSLELVTSFHVHW